MGIMRKSPFLVKQEFLSPKLCMELLRKLIIKDPDTDLEGNRVNMTRYHQECQDVILPKFQQIIPEIQEYYDLTYDALERLEFQYYPESTDIAEQVTCQNSRFERKKWVKIHDRDLTGVLWLKDFNDVPPLDMSTDVYGGKLEFPTYNFGLVPQMGTLVLYPAGPGFISGISTVKIGDLYQVRFQIKAENFNYSPDNFKGNYIEWFQEFA